MIGWILLLIGILLAGFLFLKLEHTKKTFKIAIILIILVLIYFSIMQFMSNNNADVSSPGNAIQTGYAYLSWMGHAIVNLWNISGDVISTIGNAIKGNSTN